MRRRTRPFVFGRRTWLDRDGKILRVGAAAILCAVLFRLAGNMMPTINREELVEFLFAPYPV